MQMKKKSTLSICQSDFRAQAKVFLQKYKKKKTNLPKLRSQLVWHKDEVQCLLLLSNIYYKLIQEINNTIFHTMMDILPKILSCL